MPFYEYQCSSCGHHHETLQKVSDPSLRKCPTCGRNTLRRLVSAPVFRLKGGGWYETDFKADKDSQRNLAGDKEPASADKPTTEKPKEEKAEAKVTDKTTAANSAAKTPATDKKPEFAAAKTAPKATPSRSGRARRRSGR